MMSALNGCIGGDAILWLQGNIVDERQAPYAECDAKLLDRNGKTIDERSIQPESRLSSNMFKPKPGSNFIIEFVFPGYERPVSLAISCKGSKQNFQRRVVDSGSTPESPIDLGSVVLVRER